MLHGLFHILFTIGLLTLIATMIRPTLAGRFLATPTRKGIFIRALPVLIVMAALSGMTKPDPENSTNTQDVAYGAAIASDPRSLLLQATANAKAALQQARSSGRANDPQCYLVAESLQRDLSQSIANLGGATTAASVLNNEANSVRRLCGG